MKFSTTNIIIGSVILLLIIASLTASAVRFVPYDEKTIFAKEYPFEGFAQASEYTTNPGQTPIDSYQSFLIQGDTADCKKVYGFDGLYCKPSAPETPLDVYSSAQGNTSCYGSSSGLSNSKGSLCLDAKQKSLLTTRGGNSTGHDSEIGK